MLSDKKLEKLEKILGKDTLYSLHELDPFMLKEQIVQSENSMRQALQELEANPKYEELRESLKAISQGLKDVKKRQNAIIQYCLNLLEDKGHGL